MINYIRMLFVALALAMLLGVTAPAAHADGALYQKSQKTSVLGQQMGAAVEAGNPSGLQQVVSQVTMFVLGAGLQALMASMNPPNTIDGTTYTEVYSFGRRVFSQSFQLTGNASDGSISAGLTPTQIRVPIVAYPVGPLTLHVDGGARFKAQVNLQNMMVIGIPISLSSLGLQVQATASGAGYIEGYAQFLVIRGGVGGQLDLVDLQANTNARIAFDGTPPLVTLNAMVEFLKGRLYAFLDYFSIAQWGWKRLLDYDIYKWNGFCFSTGAISCPSS